MWVCLPCVSTAGLSPLLEREASHTLVLYAKPQGWSITGRWIEAEDVRRMCVSSKQPSLAITILARWGSGA